MVLFTDEKGAPLGIAPLMRNVTARWEREKALKDQLSTLESKGTTE